jgi:hypothetical protein
MPSKPLRRIRGVSRWLVATTVLVAVANVLSTAAGLAAADDARDYLARRISEDDFLEAYTPAVLLGFVQSAAFIASIVLTMVWMFRIASNHRLLDRIGRWSPGWAIAGWFLPPFVLYVIPYLVLRELWKASDPDIAPGIAPDLAPGGAGSRRWTEHPVHPVVTAWWVLYGLAPVVLVVLQGVQSLGRGLGTGGTEELAELVDEQGALTVASSVLTVAAAAVWIVLVRSLTARHARLTGEAVAAP